MDKHTQRGRLQVTKDEQISFSKSQIKFFKKEEVQQT